MPCPLSLDNASCQDVRGTEAVRLRPRNDRHDPAQRSSFNHGALSTAEIMPAISGIPSLRVYGEQHLADIAPFLEITMGCRGSGKRKRVGNDRIDLPLYIEL